LCVLYDPPTSGVALAVAAAVLGWIFVGWGMSRYRRRYPLAVLAVLSYFLFLLPVINLFPITTLMNDRYLYLPCIPLFALLAGGLRQSADWLRRKLRRAAKANRLASMKTGETHQPRPLVRPGTPSLARACPAIVVGLLVTWYMFATWAYLPVWSNGLALWRDAVKKTPQLAVVQIQLANSLHDAGEDREAVSILEQTLSEGRPDELDRRRILEKLASWRLEAPERADCAECRDSP